MKRLRIEIKDAKRAMELIADDRYLRKNMHAISSDVYAYEEIAEDEIIDILDDFGLEYEILK